VHSSHRRSIYLLTMWQERPTSLEAPAVWRFSLEDARTGQRYGFASLEHMLAFLERQTMGRDRREKVTTQAMGRASVE
jgi:hypothetical protein